MTKVVRCRELGFDCNGVVRAPNEEEALNSFAAARNQAAG